ncbi:MAG TPA: molybdopterin-synthase adenylyltransferase MoeB [Kofleriaceae bacterium]|nr:molybdopterin-synthase adenylyltransferase MoeB [Kofleriaceae bacterium]
MPSFQSYLKAIKSEVAETDVGQLRTALAPQVPPSGSASRLPAGPPQGPPTAAAPPAVIDVREQDEYVQGYIPGARWIPRGNLELRIEDAIPDRESPVVLYCAGGTRSALAARSLRELGYTQVKSLAGGFGAWKRAGYPFDVPVVLSQEQQIRYSRHTMLPEVGDAGQVALLKSRVLCLGAGGLGSPSSMYLAAAGIGTLGIVDDDVVDMSNLQRQILHSTDRVGVHKVESAARTLNGLNPDVKVVQHRTRLDSSNALDIMGNYDVIVDGADNFQARYLVNDAALKLGIPVVHASIFRFEGQITVFPGDGGPCYRCLYPSPPPPEEAPSCAEAGVLGVLPGIMGVLQATEVIKIVLGKGNTLAGRLLVYDALKTKFRELKLRRDESCPTCGTGVDRSRIELIDYNQFCNVLSP